MTDKEKTATRDEERTAWLASQVEALLFSSRDPLTPQRIVSLVGGGAKPGDVRRAVATLNGTYEEAGRSFLVQEVAGGYQLTTRPEFAGVVSKLFTGQRRSRLTQAGLETLAIIAYRQPVTRQQIERIRGVDAGGVVTTLLERNLIRITGRSDAVGRPFLFGTTKFFLEYLGLKEMSDLPRMEDLEALLDRKEVEREVEAEVEAKLGPAPAGGEGVPPERTEAKVESIRDHLQHRPGTQEAPEGQGEIIALSSARARARGETPREADAGEGGEGAGTRLRLPEDDGAPLEDLHDAIGRVDQALEETARLRAALKPAGEPEPDRAAGAAAGAESGGEPPAPVPAAEPTTPDPETRSRPADEGPPRHDGDATDPD